MGKFAWIYFFGLCAAVSSSQVVDDRNYFATCYREYTKQGCFKSNDETGFKLVISDRDFKDRELKWEQFEKSIHSLACRCARAAKEKSATLFVIRYWAECWISKISLEDYKKKAVNSKACSNHKFKACDQLAQKECVGHKFNEYVYTLGNNRLGGDDICTVEKKCHLGQGDCDHNDQCMKGLNCGDDNCNKDIPSFDPADDCCYKPDKQGGDGACTILNHCGAGEGDCDYHSQCKKGLNCGDDNCNKTITSFDDRDDCCYKPNKKGDDGACTMLNRCGAGEGDCDTDHQCKKGLNCGDNNCNKAITSFDDTDDCCYQPDKSGGDSACTETNPCGVEEGDCDEHNQCKKGLKCGDDNCHVGKGSFDKTDDCCYQP